MADDDDYDDEPRPVRSPGIVRAAAIIWIIDGTLFTLGTCVSVAGAGMRANNGAANPGSMCGNVLGMAIAAGCLISGIMLVSGKIRDCLVPAILSLLVSLLYYGLAVLGLVFALADKPNPGNQGAGFQGMMEMLGAIMAIVGAVVGTMLALPAVLALMGRSRHIQWWDEHKGRHGRSRRRDDEEDDDYDDD